MTNTHKSTHTALDRSAHHDAFNKTHSVTAQRINTEGPNKTLQQKTKRYIIQVQISFRYAERALINKGNQSNV